MAETVMNVASADITLTKEHVLIVTDRLVKRSEGLETCALMGRLTDRLTNRLTDKLTRRLTRKTERFGTRALTDRLTDRLTRKLTREAEVAGLVR